MTINDFIQNIGVAPFAIKRLASNDVGETDAHQVGVYLPKNFVRTFFSGSVFPETLNPEIDSNFVIHSDNISGRAKIKYYNNGVVTDDGTRNESRITCVANTPLQSSSFAGNIVVLVNRNLVVEIWVCHDSNEEQIVERFVGNRVEPAKRCITGNC